MTDLSPHDLAHERRIYDAQLAMSAATTSDDRRRLWGELCALIRERSPEAVRWLERQRGLSHGG